MDQLCVVAHGHIWIRWSMVGCAFTFANIMIDPDFFEDPEKNKCCLCKILQGSCHTLTAEQRQSGVCTGASGNHIGYYLRQFMLPSEIFSLMQEQEVQRNICRLMFSLPNEQCTPEPVLTNQSMSGYKQSGTAERAHQVSPRSLLT